MTPPRYVLIANPGTKRCETYRAELRAFWLARGVAPELDVVPWADVIARDGNLDDLPAFDRPAVVRLESPGKDNDATRQFLAAGARANPSEPPQDWLTLDLPKGLLVRPGLIYKGFRRTLEGLKLSFTARPHLKPTACPLAVALMFDKLGTALTIGRAGVPVPDMLTIPAQGFDFVLGAARACGWRTAYVKLNTGSSATGIVALNAAADEPVGVTTLADLDGRFYNSRLVRRVTGSALAAAVEFVIAEEEFVQRGIPLAQLDGQNFDLRVVCVYRRPVACIFRLSPHPMTNLHLGGRRGDFARCRAAIPTREWLDALDHCADAAACFDSAIAGVDLAFERGFRRHYVLEVNAFGDFFPGWTDARGRSIHAVEIEETVKRHAGE